MLASTRGVTQPDLAHGQWSPQIVDEVEIPTGHQDAIHDSQWDYYSRKLASCSSDRTVKVWNVDKGSVTLNATLQHHDGAVWMVLGRLASVYSGKPRGNTHTCRLTFPVAWAHPKFSTVLASCGYDGTVNVYREAANNWTVIKTHNVGATSVNAIQFAPHEHGLVLACACADGHVVLPSAETARIWDSQTVHDVGNTR